MVTPRTAAQDTSDNRLPEVPAPQPHGQADAGVPLGHNGPQPPAAAKEVAEPDPFDPSTYKVAQNLAAATGVRKHLTELAVRTPDKSWWVRCHPDPKYSLSTWVLELKDEGEQYLVLPSLFPALMGEATFKPKTLYLAVTMQGKPFLWSVRRPADATKEPDRWMRAPLEAVRLAKHKWTRITWNEVTRQHDVATCESAVEPEWPDLPLRDLLELAFQDYIIKSLDHPVLRRLRGETR
jgi:hypothetical protein